MYFFGKESALFAHDVGWGEFVYCENVFFFVVFFLGV